MPRLRMRHNRLRAAQGYVRVQKPDARALTTTSCASTQHVHPLNVFFRPGSIQNLNGEVAMYVVIRKFRNMRSVQEAARRAKAGLAPILKQTPGFKSYYIFDAGNGVGGSVTLFESR